MRKSFLKNIAKALLLLSVLLIGFHVADTVTHELVPSVLAQDLSGGGQGLQMAGTEDVQISQDIDRRPLGDVVKAMVNYFIGFLGFIAVVMFVYAGVLWVVAGGNDEQITKAKKIMTYSALGLVIVILSYSIVAFITSSAGAGRTCTTDSDCTEDYFCNDENICESSEPAAECTDHVYCTQAYGPGYYCSIVGVCEEGITHTCTVDADCPASFQECNAQGRCYNPNAGVGVRCNSNSDCNLANNLVCNTTQTPGVCEPMDTVRCARRRDCPEDYSCVSGICQIVRWKCLNSKKCPLGEYCTENGTCKPSSDMTCEKDADCKSPKECDAYGLCRNPFADPDSTCQDSTDCPQGFVCNEDESKCEYQGSGTPDEEDEEEQSGVDENDEDTVVGGDTEAITDETLDEMDEGLESLMDDLENIDEAINSLPPEDQDNIYEAIRGGTLSDKMSNVQDLITSSDDPQVIAVLERLLRGLEKLKLLRNQLDVLRTVMPESEETILVWDEASEALDALIDEPINNIKLRRFEKLYRELKDLIRKFPVVQSKIKAAPSYGNVPFTVTFDGLDSIDPTGGTISDYKWSYLDNNGNLVSLGNAPVVVHEFTEPNTYSIKLQVSTSNMDASGYKVAMDGVSIVRIKASPPSSKVAFRINGVEVRDIHHVTLEEARAGIAFDPSITVPAVGRLIEKYEWTYGDTQQEERTVPATVVHSYQKAGEYFVTLKVTDSQGITDKRIIKLVVKSLAADIEFSPTEGNVNTEFRFRGINSRSDDGTIKDYEWKVTDDQGHTIVTSEQENFYHTFDRPGKYNVELLVTDVAGASDKTIEVLNVFSRKPVASFDYEIPEPNHPNTVEFSALSSYDPDQGDQITYSWDFDGDGKFEIVDTQEILVSYTYRRAGEYKASLQVQDAFGQRDQIEKNVTIDSVLSADILIKRKAAQVGEEVNFSVKSQNAVAYLWEFGDGETMSTEEEKVTHVYNKKGKYRVKLNFFDRDDNARSVTSFVLIGEGDSPVAAANVLVDGSSPVMIEDLCGEGIDGMLVTRSDNLNLSGRDSVNRDGTGRLLTYDWEFSDGGHSDQATFTRRFSDINLPGECNTVSLAVRDDISGKVSDQDTLYFKVMNELPTIIDFVMETPSTKELVTPTKVNLKVIGARDNDGQIKKYKWWYYREGFESEPLGVHSTSSAETEMVITAQGQPGVKNKYFFVVEITDNDNGVYNSTERFGEISFFEVTNGPNLSPVAEFTLDKTTIAVGDSITFISQSYDPQGEELPFSAFQWDFDGDGSFDDTTSGPQVNRQFNTPGEYEIRLKVVHRGLSSSTTRSIFVEPTNSFPQAAFIYTIDGNTVKFDGSPSRYDPDLEDTTLRFEWDFDISQDQNGNGIKDDDVESTDLTPSFTYPAAGLYRARLKVKDSLGQEGVVVRDINLDLSAADRERNTCRNIEVTSLGKPITTLTTMVSPCQVGHSGTVDIAVTVQNADNSPYYGTVFFELLEGSGDFTPNPVEAKDGRAQTIFMAADPGIIRIKVTASSTYYGDLTEEILINVN